MLLEYSSDRTIKTSYLVQAVTGEWEEVFTALLSWREDFLLAEQDALQATLLKAISECQDVLTHESLFETTPRLQQEESYRITKRLLTELRGQPM